MIAVCISVTALLLSAVGLWRIFRIEARARKWDEMAQMEQTAWGGVESPSESAENGLEDDKYQPFDSSDETFITRLDELIDANLSNHDLNVDFLAAGMMVSRSLLFNRVRRATGKGIVEYVNAIRIERSTELFADENRSLTEIAELCGFSTLRYYSRVFKSVKGEIPSVYRERILAEKRNA